MNAKPPNRRPLASRDTTWARSLSLRLANAGVTPNTVSATSIVFAVLACICGVIVGGRTSIGIVASKDALWLIGLALCSQLRLLCNLLDGMIAIEARRQSPDGAVWNEFPDRIADVLILLGVGLAIGQPALGWASGTMAVLTAYVRELGKGLDGVADFCGPLAKPQRMAVITAACAIAAIALLAGNDAATEPHGTWAVVLAGSLWLVALGSAFTAGRRAVRLIKRLHDSSVADPN